MCIHYITGKCACYNSYYGITQPYACTVMQVESCVLSAAKRHTILLLMHECSAMSDLYVITWRTLLLSLSVIFLNPALN